jgi:hypothetical protein
MATSWTLKILSLMSMRHKGTSLGGQDANMANCSLKPCPFCGIVPQLARDHDGTVRLACQNCRQCAIQPCTRWYPSETEAVAAWNERRRQEEVAA